MNKVLKRILIILVILIGAIIAIPKEENAVTLNELKDKSKLTGENRLIGETFDGPFSDSATNKIWANTDGKYFCIDRMNNYGKEYKLAYKFIVDYKNNKFYYSFIDFTQETLIGYSKDDQGNPYILDKEDNSNNEYTKKLAKLIYIARNNTINGRGYTNNGVVTNYYTPYAYSEQNAFWYLLDDWMNKNQQETEENWVRDIFFHFRQYSDPTFKMSIENGRLKVISHWNEESPLYDSEAYNIIDKVNKLSNDELKSCLGAVYVYTCPKWQDSNRTMANWSKNNSYRS